MSAKCAMEMERSMTGARHLEDLAATFVYPDGVPQRLRTPSRYDTHLLDDASAHRRDWSGPLTLANVSLVAERMRRMLVGKQFTTIRTDELAWSTGEPLEVRANHYLLPLDNGRLVDASVQDAPDAAWHASITWRSDGYSHRVGHSFSEDERPDPPTPYAVPHVRFITRREDDQIECRFRAGVGVLVHTMVVQTQVCASCGGLVTPQQPLHADCGEEARRNQRLLSVRPT
jgi:hypothetical protein